MKKKKIILAVLASLCVATSAAGIAACSNSGTAPSRDPTLYAAYQVYAQSTDNPLSYTEWVADIIAKFTEGGEKGPQGDKGEDAQTLKEVKLINVNGKEYYEFIFHSGRIIRLATDGSDKQQTTGFTIRAVDQNGDPVENVYFSIGYRDASETYYMTENGSFVTNSNFSQVYAAKTNSRGIAEFYTFPESDHDFNVYVADPSSISEEGNIASVPNGYQVKFGKDDLLGWELTSAPFVKDANGNYSITVSVVMDNSWRSLYKAQNDLQYKRYANGTEVYSPYVKNAQRNRYNYFTLEPYGSNVWDEAAGEAASGIYRLSWTANNPAANVQLLSYNFTNGMYFYANEDGSPSDLLVNMHSGNVPTNETLLRQRYKESGSSKNYETWLAEYTKKFTGSNYVDVTIEFDSSFLAYCLAFISDTNCEVTISVERIGDVPTWSDVQVTAKLPANAAKEDEHEGRIIDVPLNSTIVKDANGLYHKDNVNGPIIYVQLLKGTRANEMAMRDLTSYTVGEGSDASTRSAFNNYVTEEFDEATNSGVRIHTDYTDVVKSYSSFANSDGLYPVNDQIKTILETFCKSFSGWNRYDNYWVAACSYYGPVADGTQNAPYDLVTGTNTLNLNGKTYVSFKAGATGYYGFSSSNGTVAISNAINVDGAYYVNVANNQEIVFAITGNGEATVTVTAIASNKIIECYYEDPNIVGTDSTPVTIIGSGVYQVNINHDMSNGNRVAVNITALPLADGEYTVTIYGSNTAEVLNAELQSVNGGTISLKASTPTRLWLDDVNNSTFFIKITKVS